MYYIYIIYVSGFHWSWVTIVKPNRFEFLPFVLYISKRNKSISLLILYYNINNNADAIE